MKNIINEVPNKNLKSRLRYSSEFVADSDIKNKRILDIGCGYGWFELNVLDRKVKQITGIDISSTDLETAKSHIKDKRVVFKVGVVPKLPFEDNCFDTVVAWEVIEHIPKNTEDTMFREIYRVLKKNGVFYLSTPYDSFFSNFFDPAFLFIGHRHYSEKKLKAYGEKNSFKVSKLNIKGGFWGLIALLNMYISKWIFRRSPFFEENICEKEDKEYSIEGKGFMGIFVKYIKTK